MDLSLLHNYTTYFEIHSTQKNIQHHIQKKVAGRLNNSITLIGQHTVEPFGDKRALDKFPPQSYFMD